VSVERHHIGDVLVGSHNYHAASIAIDATHIEYVAVAFEVRAVQFLVVAKPVPTFRRQKELRHCRKVQLAMTLLDHGSDIDQRVDITFCRRVSPHRRLGRVNKKVA